MLTTRSLRIPAPLLLACLACLACLAVACALLFITATPAAAQSAPTATVVADRLNVRSGPGTSYAVVGSAKTGEKLTVTGQSGSCAWLKVSRAGAPIGWVSGSKALVTLSAPCSGIPAATAPAAGNSSGSAAGSSAGSAASPNSKQGCAILVNKLGFAVQLGVKRSDGVQSSWSIPAGASRTACVDPGAYTATFSATGRPGSLVFPFTVKGGEYYQIPLSLTR